MHPFSQQYYVLAVSFAKPMSCTELGLFVALQCEMDPLVKPSVDKMVLSNYIRHAGSHNKVSWQLVRQ